jgi:outer membrane biosynthesis protein TonB
MDPRIQIVVRRLQVGPYDVTAFSRIRDQLAALREGIAAAGDQETLKNIIALIDKWAQSTHDQNAASMAQFEAASLCEVELQDVESAVQRYVLSLKLNPGNVESFHRLVPLLRNQGDVKRLETILNQQQSALAGIDTVEPSVRVEVLREIAKVGAEKNRNLNGAIQALEEIVNLEPDLSDVKELARLRSVRGQTGDVERAADLFYTMGDVLGALEGMEMVSNALDLNPAHEEALGLLEQWTPQQEHFATLKYRWAAYLEKAPSGSAADERRLNLAQAYGASNEFQKGLDCIAPLFKRGDTAAKEIHIKLRAGLEVANKASQALRPSSPKQPLVASGTSSPRRMKRTMVGYKVDKPTGETGLPAAAPQPFTPPTPQARRIHHQPPGQTTDPSPPKPPAIAAVPVPASALISPDAGRVPAVVQESNGSYQQVDVVSLPPGATSEPPIPISLPPEQLLDSSDTTMEYESLLRKKSRLPWFVAAGIVLLSATGFAAYQFTSSENARDATQQESSEPAKEESPQPAEPVVTPKAEEEKEPVPSAEAQQPPVEEKTATETAEPSGKSTAEAQEAQVEEPPKRKDKAKASNKKSGPVVELVTKRARFKRGKVDKKSVYALLEKNMPKIERCYARALKRKKRLKGRVTFAWTIKKSGYVYGAKRIQGPIKDKKMINCVRGVLNKIRYKRPKRESARVIMPFLFKRPK